MAKRKKARRQVTGSTPRDAADTPLDQMRRASADLLREGRAEEAVALVLQAVDAVLRQNRNLELLVMKLRREQLGMKSERVDSSQMSLMFEDYSDSLTAEAIDTDREKEEREDAKLEKEIDGDEAVQDRPKRERQRHAWSKKNVEVREFLHELCPEERGCEDCGETKEPIGEEITRRLVYVPGHFAEEVHHCVKYGCAKCRRGTIPTAPAPPQVIERSVADASLLAHVVVSKYVDHNPLTRLQESYAREGVTLPVSTLADWVADTADVLAPVADANERRVLESVVVGTDATGIKVLDPSSPENIVRGTIWCYVGDQKTVVFRYTPTGEGATGPWSFLRGRKGYVQADAHNVFDRLFNGSAAECLEIGCWFHARRGVFALKDTDNRVAYPLLLIRRLYRLEYLADLRKLEGEERARFRQERSESVLDRIKRWADYLHDQEPPDTDIAKAAGYFRNHWTALGRFVRDGRLGLDNSIVERQIRYIALGRKNYLFCGSHEAAVRTARLYSLVRTCALNGVLPLPYLTDVLRKIAGGWPQRRIDELLPDRWALSQPP